MMKRIIKILSATILVAFLSLGNATGQEVRNVIFMIGDGMGLGAVSATMINQGYEPMQMERAQYIGLSKTYSANNRVTDSAASATAMATGHKTDNGKIGVDPDLNRLETILEKACRQGFATGIIVNCQIVDATPAGFIAHAKSRRDYEDIALCFLDTEIDVFIGGGLKFFNNRSDDRDLVKELIVNGYNVVYDINEFTSHNSGKVAGLLAEGTLPSLDKRADYLQKSTAKTMELLSKSSDKGFFLMIEGARIDGAAHDNKIRAVINETVDFDKAVGIAFDFADRNPGTLVIVTADHETGGITIPSGKADFELSDQGVEYHFSTKSHTGTLVPIYAYGAGAENFSRVMENTDIPKIIEGLIGISSRK